jgi:hypothetical protein
MTKQAQRQAENLPAIQADFDLVLAGERIDGRTVMARHFRQTAGDLVSQLGNIVSPSEKMMLRHAATLSILCEMDVKKLIEGEEIDHENYRRNVQALRSSLIGLGLAKKSRDITKGDAGRLFDAHTAAILDAD